MVASALPDRGHSLAALARWLLDGGTPGLFLLHACALAALGLFSVLAAGLRATSTLGISIGGDGLRVRGIFGSERVVRFSDVRSVDVQTGVCLALKNGESIVLYPRPCLLVRGLDAVGSQVAELAGRRYSLRAAQGRMPYDDHAALPAEVETAWSTTKKVSRVRWKYPFVSGWERRSL